MSALLSVKNLKVSYGGINAVKGIDLQVDRGELVALIGANGAGKSSSLKAISGVLTPFLDSLADAMGVEGVSVAPVVAPGPVDIGAVRATIAQLRDLLAANDTEANTLMTDHADALRSALGSSVYSLLQEAVDDFDYDTALTLIEG